jgi:exonuclease VII small subunit
MVKDRNEQRLRLTEEMLSLFARGVELVAEGHDSVETARSTGNLCGSGKGWSGN